MFYDEYLKYKSHYSESIKEIKYRSHFYNLNENQDDISIKEMAGNFDLFFDENGNLNESKHFRNKQYIAKYHYQDLNDEEVLNFIEETICGKNYADTISEFIFDFKNRITLQKIDHIHDEIQIQINTVYFEDKEIEFYDNINDKNWEGFQVLRYKDDKVIRNTMYLGDRSIMHDYHYEYNDEQNSITEISYGEDNSKDISVEIFDEKGLLIENTFFYNGKKIVRKYEFVYNDRNDWISQMVTDNGEPRFVIDREIIYY